MSKSLSFPKSKIKIVLLEKIHEAAADVFKEAGYEVELISSALQGAELDSVIADAHIMGVRSRTKIRAPQLEQASRLLAVGCFSVGTDQVELAAASQKGVPVFNAPHSSTRSVAELTIANVFALARKMATQSARMHEGTWNKSAIGSYELRGKTIGVVGYGHIGQQVGLLAEALGMDVLFYDVVKKLPMGRAKSVASLKELLQHSQFVSLHVPGGAETEKIIGKEELDLMPQGSYLLNLSRGKVVDLSALAAALDSGKLAGAGLDVFPEEPASNEETFDCPISKRDNVILTPHIGGSTEEAQRNIGCEVAESLIRFLDNGSTHGAVNFPQVHLPSFPNSHRILNTHENAPGVLRDINQVVADVGANIEAQYLSTRDNVGYLIMDINKEVSTELYQLISALPASIRTRILY